MTVGPDFCPPEAPVKEEWIEMTKESQQIVKILALGGTFSTIQYWNN